MTGGESEKPARADEGVRRSEEEEEDKEDRSESVIGRKTEVD